MKKYPVFKVSSSYLPAKGITNLLVRNPYIYFIVSPKRRYALLKGLENYTKVPRHIIEKKLVLDDLQGDVVRIKATSIPTGKILLSTSYGYITTLLYLTGLLPYSNLMDYLCEVHDKPNGRFNLQSLINMSIKKASKVALLDSIGMYEFDYLNIHAQYKKVKESSAYRQEVADWVADESKYSKHSLEATRKLYNYQYDVKDISQYVRLEYNNTKIPDIYKILKKWLDEEILVYNSVQNYKELDNLMRLHNKVHIEYSHNTLISDEPLVDISDLAISDEYAVIPKATLDVTMSDASYLDNISKRTLSEILKGDKDVD